MSNDDLNDALRRAIAARLVCQYIHDVCVAQAQLIAIRMTLLGCTCPSTPAVTFTKDEWAAATHDPRWDLLIELDETYQGLAQIDFWGVGWRMEHTDDCPVWVKRLSKLN